MTVTKLKQATIKTIEPRNHHPLQDIPISQLTWGNVDPQDLKVVRVSSNAMEPEYRTGDYVLVDTTWTVPYDGCDFIIGDLDHPTIKKTQTLYTGCRPNKLRLVSTNKDYESFEVDFRDIKICGRIIGKWTRK